MPDKEEKKERKRMVVEEVKADETPEVDEKKVETAPEPEISEEAAKDKVSTDAGNETEKETVTEEKTTEDVKEYSAPEPRKSSSIALWIIIPGIFILGAILGGIVFYQRGVSSTSEGTPTSTASPVASPSASASPSATIDLTKYTINIFNGSGIAGEAGKAKTLLTTAGFKVGTTANAATYDYTKTIIKAKSTVEAAYITALSTALGKTYVVDTAQTLATTSADTVQIVIGSSKAP